MHALRHIHKRAARPDRPVQRGKFVVTRRDQLHEILAEYPKEIREAFIAHILDDETIPSLAAYYGIKNDTLRKQIGRMKTRIAQAIPEKDMKTFLFMLMLIS